MNEISKIKSFHTDRFLIYYFKRMNFIKKNSHYFSTNINVRYYSVQYLTVMSYPVSQQFSKFTTIDYLTITQIVTPITTLVMARETAAIVIFDVGGK